MRLSNLFFFLLSSLLLNCLSSCSEDGGQRPLTEEENVYNGIAYRLQWKTETEGREKALIDTGRDLDTLVSKYNLDSLLAFRVDSLRRVIEPEFKKIWKEKQESLEVQKREQKRKEAELNAKRKMIRAVNILFISNWAKYYENPTYRVENNSTYHIDIILECKYESPYEAYKTTYQVFLKPRQAAKVETVVNAKSHMSIIDVEKIPDDEIPYLKFGEVSQYTEY